MSTIKDVRARIVFNSRGEPTVEVEVELSSGYVGRASAPSGKSVGKHEVVAYPPGGPEESLDIIRSEVAPELIGMECDDQESIDIILHKIDGTENFSRLGGNAAFAVSLACAKAASLHHHLPLFQYLGGAWASEIPIPLGNTIGGGKHSAGPSADIQEMLVIPLKAASIRESLTALFSAHKRVSQIYSPKTSSPFGRNDEGAWTLDLADEECLSLLWEACSQVAEEMGIEMRLGLDVAASSLWDPKSSSYVYRRKGTSLTREEQIEHILSLIREFDLFYVEDPLHEDDFDGFSELRRRAGPCLICGDDLTVTSKQRISIAYRKGSVDAVIIKPNQVGTLTDTLEAVRTAKNYGIKCAVSHRSGEVEDGYLAHLAVGFGSEFIKTGVVGGERVAKLNELIRIEELLANRARMVRLEQG